MRRALDWLVVDEGGRAAGVVPFGGGGMMPPSQADQRSLSDMCAKVMDALRGRAVQEVCDEAASAGAGAIR